MIVALDLETTWLDNENDKIIEVALIKFDEKTFEIIDTYSTLVNPEMDIPKMISNITNIYDEDVLDSPKIEEILDNIISFIWDFPILWHNTYFDRNFLIKNEVPIEKNIVLDTFFISNFLWFKEKSQNLEMLSNSFWIKLEWAHRAVNDVDATIKLFKRLLEESKKLPEDKISLLSYIFSKSKDQNIIFLKNLLFENEKDIKTDDFKKKLLNKIWKEKNGRKIILNDDKKQDSVEKVIKQIKNLEVRWNQIEMLKIVYDTIKGSKKSVIDAPTWLWKSFAYLIPSIIHSLNSWEKVFISTKTKTLQDQLFYKDLKFLENNLDKFNYSKLKWKRNYISIYRLFEFLEVDNLDYDKVSFLSKIILWLFESEHWELDELNYYWKEYSFLRFLNADDSFTLKEKNPYKSYEFIFKARNKINSSNVIIVNHSLLFSDLVSDNSLLWNVDNLIIDEAHTIEDVSTESLKSKLDKKALEEVFSYIEKILSKKWFKKIDFLNLKEELLINLDLILDYCSSYISSKILDENQFFKKVLVLDDFFNSVDFKPIIRKIENSFLDIIDKLSTIDVDFSREKAILENYLSVIKICLDENSKEKFISIFSENDKWEVFLEYTFLNPWDYLKKNLWCTLNSCILTSATLKVWDNFDYIKKSLSLSEWFDFHSFETQFDYKKQSTLFIPNDIWSIKNNSSNVIGFLRNFFLKVWWNTLVLLTSFNIIKNIYLSLNSELKNNNVNLYAQWLGWWRHKLIEFFKQRADNSILMWTDSFWEWIDIPWSDLKYLVIHKVPFMVPTDPIFQARSRLFDNPFSDYSIPKAIIKLKQWFGRLIRTNKDTWVVVFLDDRIYSTQWWKEFYKSFPEEINIKLWSSDNFLDIL